MHRTRFGNVSKSENEQRTLEQALQRAAAAEAAAQQRANELAVIERAQTALLSNLELEAVLGQLAEQLGSAFDVTSTYISSYDPQTQMITVVAEYFGAEASDVECETDLGSSYCVPRDFPMMIETLRCGAARLFHLDQPDVDAATRSHMERYNIKTVLELPVFVHGEAVAYACLWESRRQREFSAEEIALAQRIAHYAGLALENARIYSQAQQEIAERARVEEALRESERRYRELFVAAQRQADELALSEQAQTALLASLDLSALLGKVAEQMCRALDMTSVYISRFDAEHLQNTVEAEYFSSEANPLESISDLGETFDLSRLFPGLAEVITQGRPTVHSVDDAVTHPSLQNYIRSFDAYTILQLPILIGDEIAAFVWLWESRHPRVFRDEEIALAQRIARYAGIALQNARLYEQARQEINERKQLERELIAAREAALESSRLKSAFLANVSHEIRTPMNGVIGMLDLLRSTPLSREQQECVQIAASSGKALLALLNDILDFSKIEAGKLTLHAVSFDLHAIVAEVVSLFAETATAAGLTLTTSLAPDLPRFLRGDPVRLRQVLTNLVGNAVKFTPAGAVTLRVTCDRELPSAEPASATGSHSQAPSAGLSRPQFTFEVWDTGIGLTKEQLVQLFMPFSQVDLSTTRRYSGSGLGLAISRQLADLMGGTISVSSTAGVGSTFVFVVPLELSQQIAPDETLGPLAIPRLQTPAGGRPRVLVAEDNLVNQKVVVRQLERLGVDVDVVANGVLALEALEQTSYALILMDIQMPELDGFATTVEIRRREGYRRTPIVALTAHALQGERERCISVGMDGYLSKPITQEDLAAVLRRWLAEAGAMPVISAPALNPEVIEQLRLLQLGSKINVLVEIIDLFLEDTPPRLTELRRAAEQDDGQALQEIAHSLKGSAGNLGAERLVELCCVLEDQGRNNMLQVALTTVADVELEFARVKQALEAERLK